ncbi:MAG: glycosyltransferase [Verrucomicrobia bacterium]|nr:glycosyltransferase [Verrucomicrobiota bacterium]
MKIAVVVHGRFHAFDLVRELIGLGNEVLLLTNYPRRWPEKFGVPERNVRSLVAHGIVSRAALALGKAFGTEKLGEAFLHRWFGNWAAQVIARDPVDASHCFTGVALETLLSKRRSQKVCSIVRGSSHICVQRRILEEEERRAGRRIDKPSNWMVMRELQEYWAADLIICLSQFALESFVEEGVPKERLFLNPLGVQQKLFAAPERVLQERRKRILKGKLRVLTTGSFSLRKGALDYLEVAEKMKGRMEFVFRGDVAPDARCLRSRAEKVIRFLPRVEQHKLPEDYFRADLFLFPTLEDGYAAVLAQASAAGLPILATTNCGARDFLTEGKDAWIYPIRRPDLIIERLEWCDLNRKQLAALADQAGKPKPGIEWRERAQKLVEAYDEFIRKKKN